MSDYKQGFIAGFDRYFEELLNEAELVKDRIERQRTGIGSTETYNKGFAQGLAEAKSNALTSLTFESQQAEEEAEFFDKPDDFVSENSKVQERIGVRKGKG